MAKQLFKVILDIEYPYEMADDEAPTGPGFSAPAAIPDVEAARVIRDGCESNFTFCHINRRAAGNHTADAAVCVEEV